MRAADAIAVKRKSERIIRKAGGRVNRWLPRLDVRSHRLRSRTDVLERALAMSALLHLGFGAPTGVIRRWIGAQRVTRALSPRERSILSRPRSKLKGQELTDLRWYPESLWALMWAGGLVAGLDFTGGVPDTMASLCPNLRAGEDGAKFAKLKLRPYGELFAMLDLHFRLHWYARDGWLNGYDTPPVSHSVIMERRKALEWLLDPGCDWDSVPDGT